MTEEQKHANSLNKLETVLDYLKETYKSHYVSERKSHEEGYSYDFPIDTGTARITIKFRRHFWEERNAEKIVHHLKEHQPNINRAVSDNQNTTIKMGGKFRG